MSQHQEGDSSLFNRMACASAKKVTPNLHTYSIILDCFYRMGRLGLGFATFGRILKTGWMVDAIVLNHLLRALCDVKRRSDPMDIVLRQMPVLGCTPDVFSFNILLKELCDENKNQEALELLHTMAHNGGSCAPDVVSYTTVTDGLCKEGRVDNAYNLFCEMLDHGIDQNVVTCNSIIDGLCKAQEIDKAEATLQQMLDKGVTLDCFTYTSLLHEYCSFSMWNEVIRILKEMCRVDQKPNIVTYTTLIDYLCKNRRCAEARQIFDSMVEKGEKPNVTTYGSQLYGYAIQGNFIEMTHLIDLVVQNKISSDHHVFNILMNACGKHGMVDEAMLTFNKMQWYGLMPNTVSYGSVIDALCRAGRLDDAMFQFNQMINEGQPLNIYIFTTLIHGFQPTTTRRKLKYYFLKCWIEAFVQTPLSSGH
jgi:pentatricopeptide repeat protein